MIQDGVSWRIYVIGYSRRKSKGFDPHPYPTTPNRADGTCAPYTLPTEQDKEDARELAQKMMKDNVNVDFSTYRNETLAYLAGMVSMYDQMLVKDLAEYKLYVVNKLVEQSANPDPKYSFPAIKSLGEVDGVDAFKKRAEITVQHKSVEEVEKSLMQKLDKLERLAAANRKRGVTDVEDVDAKSSKD
jgi:hypothetical protein